MQHITILERLRALLPSRTQSEPATRGTLIPFVRRKVERTVALALQGGGAHGAFTWGVVDRILEDPQIRIEAISGASAGAINAAVLASGHAHGGAEAARENFQAFWQNLAQLARMSPLQPTPLATIAFGRDMELSFSYMWRDVVSRVISPYQFNPLDLNPLRDLLLKFVDFDALRGERAIRLLVAATNAETGASRIFRNDELSVEVLLASACLPTVHQAQKLDGGYYWDGGFTANPPLLPLIEATAARDVVVVRLNPAEEKGLPVTAPKIQTRLSRIVFDAALKQELEALDRLRCMAAESGHHRSTLGRRLADLRLHMIGEDALMNDIGGASQMHPDWRFVHFLRDHGRAAGTRWLSESSESAAQPATQRRRAASALSVS
jgi:NTE family protein